MLDVIQNTRINSDAVEDDLKPGEYRDALNISLIANESGAFSKGTTYGNIDTEIVFNYLNPDAICLGCAIDTAGARSIVAFYQRVPVPLTPEYDAIMVFALSRGMKVPSPEVQAAQNLLIFLLKQDAIWAGLDCFFCFFGDGDVEFAKINWKNPTLAGMAANSGMTYQTDSGFKGDGISAFLNTKFNPSTAVKFLLNNASITIGYEDIILGAGAEGVKTAAGWTTSAPYTASDSTQFAINAATDLPVVVSDQISGGSGIYFYSRASAGFNSVRQNTGIPQVNAVVSTGRPTLEFYIGAINDNGNPANFSLNTYSFFAAGESLNTFDREIKFYFDWQTYQNTFTNDLVDQLYIQEVLLYLLVDQEPKIVNPLVKSSKMRVTQRSYLDGYSFVNELFFFNFRESAPKVINIVRATESPGFYDELEETALTVIKPHPPYSPVPTRASSGAGALPNSPIQKKPFQFMCLYRFLDGEQSTKSPVSEYLNSMDDVATVNSLFDFINVTIKIPAKDYPIVESIELYVRNTNNIGDWRSVTLLPKKDFLLDVPTNHYNVLHQFRDDAIGGFMPLDIATKINDTVPQKSNYLAFIENRLFLIDSLLDYNFVSTFQIRLTLDDNSASKVPDDRAVLSADPRYALAEFEYDSEYIVGIAFYDEFGRKYPSSINDRRFTTPVFVPVGLPVADTLPGQHLSVANAALLNKSKITAKYDLRAAGNDAFYGKPPYWAYWWGMIRTKNTKWEFQQSIQCILRFPYSITKWGDTDPANFPDPNLFLEDGYLYWHPEKLLNAGGVNLTKTLVNEYIDIIIPSSFPYVLDKNILIDFMMQINTNAIGTKITMVNREVVETFANKIRIRGDRLARWFSNDNVNIGHYRMFPKYTTGIDLLAAQPLRRDETTFPLILKRRRGSSLDNIILYDTPQIYPIPGGGSLFSTFQPGQSITVSRVDFPPSSILPSVAKVLVQQDTLVQPIFLEPTTVAINHSIRILWGPNVGDSVRLKLEVSLWQLNDLKQPIQKLIAARTGADGRPFFVGNSAPIEYSIAPRTELTTGWYGYGITVLDAQASAVQFVNNLFDVSPANPDLYGWKQSNEGLPALAWAWVSAGANNHVYVQIAAMGTGYSKTIYQLLQADKEDLSIAVVVEATGLIGPITNGATSLVPGDSGIPAANDTTETLKDLSEFIVPYFINCAAPPRVVTLNKLLFTKTTISPAGCTVQARLWNLTQDPGNPTNPFRPTSPIAGSEGPVTALPTAIPGAPVQLSFGANLKVNTSGWYGISLLFDGPSFSDFGNKDYANGDTVWIKTGPGTPWSFQANTATEAVYGEPITVPAQGAAIGFVQTNAIRNILTPIFIPASANPYDTNRILVEWGDNSAARNGWEGKNITVGIWELDGALKPTSDAPVYSNVVTIGSGVKQTYLVTGSNIVGGKYYGFGLRNPVWSGSSIIFTQFLNPGFTTSLTNWNGATSNWVWNANAAQASMSGTGAGFDSGRLVQTPNQARYIQVVLPGPSLIGFTQVYAELWLGSGVVQTLNLGNGSAYHLKSISFDTFYVPANTAVSVRFLGTGPGTCTVRLPGIFNSWNPYGFSTPLVKKYAVASANNETWIQGYFGSQSGGMPRDPSWGNGYTYWAVSNVGQVGGAVLVITEDTLHIDNTAPSIILSCNMGVNQVTNFVYGLYGFQDSPALTMDVYRNLVGKKYVDGSGSAAVQIWVFNDPANPTGTGVMVESLPMGAGGSFENFSFGDIVTYPGGYKYYGIRVVSNSAIPSLWMDDHYLQGAGATSIRDAWMKDEIIGTTTRNTLGISAQGRTLVTPAGTIIANYNINGLAPSATSGRLGQNSLSGGAVSASIELFNSAAANTYDLILTDTNGFELGRTANIAQNNAVTQTITVQVVNPPTTDGLYLSIQNKNAVGNLSARIRQITNTNLPVKIGASNAVSGNSKTWEYDSSKAFTRLATTSFTSVQATEDIPQVPNPVTVVLADAAGVEISLPQTFDPNVPGQQTLTFAPTLAVLNNLNYGVKVKNNPANSLTAGVIKIHSITNIARNDGVANIIANTINPGQPFYEAWIGHLGSVPTERYTLVTNFIAVVSDLIMSPFTPVAINPTSYHLVANMVQAGIEGHSNTYSPPIIPYNYGIPYPSISSDPDAAGIVYIEKTGQSIGDINLRILDLGESQQSNIVRWSDPIIVGTRTNNTNAFSDGNKYPVDFQRGEIQVMVAMHDHTLFCVHTQGMSSLYVGRSLVTSPSEIQAPQDELVLSNKVVGNDNKLTSNLGTVNPESVKVVESGTIAYGFDLIRKSFWQKTNNGVRNLTYECNAKKLFNEICFNRLLAYNDGEDVKIYAGYNEKHKTFYLSFAEFRYKGETYPAVTIAYNVYIDGFLSRYSFEPMSYLATEDTIHTVKARSLNDPDFFGDFSFWLQDSSTSDFAWILKYGQWNDFGYWDDEEYWIDSV